ncbi:hypothetical protein JZ751_012171, partial [Albula glossodonta]
IGGLKDHYLFSHHGMLRRAPFPSHGKHSLITLETEVDWIQQQVVKRRVKRGCRATPTTQFTDPEWNKMWYMFCGDGALSCQSSMNIVGAWGRGYTGKDVVVTILDDGIERNHTDLIQNYDPEASYDINEKDYDPMPRYDSSNTNNASWGPDDDGQTVDGPAPLALLALESGAKLGRKGRGSIFVWASGNGGQNQDHCSCDGYTNSIYTISISSTTKSGSKPWYLEEYLRQGCTDGHTGTSDSASIAAGIIALTLEANSQLTWRDVQHIIVRTSRTAHLSSAGWHTNAAGYQVSHLYGFGLMDAEAMVREAEGWRQVPSQHTCVENTDRSVRAIPPHGVVRVTHKAMGCSHQPLHYVSYLEHVVVKLSITHPRRGHLSINLISPSGTKSKLLSNRPLDRSADGFKNWEFMTTHCWGERAAGEWILEIHDSLSQPERSQRASGTDADPGACFTLYRSGKLIQWSLVLYGTSLHPYTSPHQQRPRSAELPTEEDKEYSGAGEEACTGCAEGFLLEEWMCDSNCLTCVGPKATCSRCVSGLSLQSGRCVHISSCKDGKALEEGRCDIGCSPGKYLSDGQCHLCDHTCGECSGAGPGNCTTCERDKFGVQRYLFNGTCVGVCPEYHFQSEERTCEPCPVNCRVCRAPNFCLKCDSSYLPNDGVCTPLECGEGQVEDPEYGECMMTCSGPDEDDCDSCQEEERLNDGMCVREQHPCPRDTFLNGEGECESCHSSCESCWGEERNQCSTCARGFPVGQVCQRCAPECASCEGNALHCLSCVEPLVLHGHHCAEACPPAHFLEVGLCYPCPPSCQDCTAENLCAECEEDYFLHEGMCVEDCPAGSYQDVEEEACVPCSGLEQGHCGPCTEPGAMKYRGECRSECPSNTYHDSLSRECKDCEESCLTCRGPGPKSCSSCREEMMLDVEGRCVAVTDCPSPSYRDQQGKCQPCHSHCARCSGPGKFSCLSCHHNHFLLSE